MVVLLEALSRKFAAPRKAIVVAEIALKKKKYI